MMNTPAKIVSSYEEQKYFRNFFRYGGTFF